MSMGPQTREAAEAAVHATVMDDEASAGARAYSEALINVAAKDDQVDAVLGEIDAIEADVLRAHPRFAEMLASPTRPQADKDRILIEAFEGRAHPTVVRFLRVLNHHGRLGLLGAIARQARAIWDRRQNRRRVTVRSAVPLDEGQQAALWDRLTRLAGATPVVRWDVDPGLIGGLVVQVGDDVYDASVRSRLAQMRARLVAAKAREAKGLISL